MSTVAPAIEAAPQPSSTSTLSATSIPRAAAATTPKGRFAFLRKNSFAFADQVLISGTNFVAMVLMARALDKPEFGAFQVIFGGLLFANIFQSTLVTQAHNVLGANRTGEEYRRYTTATAFWQILVLALELLVAVPLAVVAFARGWSSAAMLLAVIPAILFWQLQEFVRRVLYTEQRYSRAFFNDLIGYGGQTLILIALFASYKLRGTAFDGALALYAIAGASAVAAMVGAFQLRRDLVRHIDWNHIRENWRFGRWLAGGELMGWCSSLHMQGWWAALLIGTVASADLRAAMILFGPARVISFFLSSVLPNKFARALNAGGADALHAKIKFVYLGLIPVVGTYCLLLALFPRQVLWLIYGQRYVGDGTAVQVLVLYSLAAFLNYMVLVMSAALTASRQTHHIFLASLAGCIVALALSPLLIKTFGANGGILSMIATTLVVGALFISAYFRRVRYAKEAT
ncbi:MAG: hypothetical protein QOF78_3435 [Phycisphaerales bacterium]|jgi:O-antigen/teichoic acid export membrane protein|nr:hypothetical protein [Phycisphaerales bacterium]